MKKLTVLCLVLVAVLAIGSVGFAAPGDRCEDGLYPFREDKGDTHSLEFGVVGVVEPYASMYYIPREEEAPRLLELWWDGSKEEFDAAKTFFIIKSNTPISLTMDFEALRTWNPHHKKYFYIDTTVVIERLGGNVWAPKLAGTVTANSRQGIRIGDEDLGFTRDWIQTVDLKNYRMTVSGKLKDIHDQSAGEYETGILLTISGYAPAN